MQRISIISVFNHNTSSICSHWPPLMLIVGLGRRSLGSIPFAPSPHAVVTRETTTLSSPSSPPPQPSAITSSSSSSNNNNSSCPAPFLSPRDVRVAVLPFVPVDKPISITELLRVVPPHVSAFLQNQTILAEHYFTRALGTEFEVLDGYISRATGKPVDMPPSRASPPPSPSFAASKGASQGGFVAQQNAARSATTGFRSPSEVLDLLIEYIPTYFVSVRTVEQQLPPEITSMFGSQTIVMFLKKYRFYFEVQQQHGVMEVKLKTDVSHHRRGIADVKYAAGVDSVDFLQNINAQMKKVPRNSEANLVMGLAPKCPAEFTPIGEFLSSVSEYISNHPAFDSRLGVTGLIEKYPEYFQIVEGKIRVRPSTVAPNALDELHVGNSLLPKTVSKLVAALHSISINSSNNSVDGDNNNIITAINNNKSVESAQLFALLTIDEKQAIKKLYRTFPRFIRSHGKEFVLSQDNTQVRKFIPELERSADALASERLEMDSLSPNDPIHQIPASMDSTNADWAIKELYEALPLMQAAELDDFKLILPQSVRDALPNNLAEVLLLFTEHFKVWKYPDDLSVNIVQRAKLITPDISPEALAAELIHMVPQGGINADKLLRKVSMPTQRYLYANGIKTTIKEKLGAYLIVEGDKIFRIV